MNTANIIEIFSSVQGEGLFVGCRQVFVRFAGCNLRCDYCDTASGLQAPVVPDVQVVPQYGNHDTIVNPVTVQQTKQCLTPFLMQPHHSVSLTGGEPLLQADFLTELLPMLSDEKIFLETNGTMPDRLCQIIRWTDVISMDIKLPSSCHCEQWAEHDQFIAIAKNKELYVKMVVTGLTTLQELEHAASIIAAHDRAIPVILQPVTPVEGCRKIVSGVTLADYQRHLMSILHDVRIIPQTHKLMGLR